jgi:beta-1,2-mannobiose phosphorylase / 1,2-beta-oligomannan phosphorylase
MIKFVGTAQHDKASLLYFSQTKEGQSSLNAVTSHDGFEFVQAYQPIILLDHKQQQETMFDWIGFRIAKQQHSYFLSYIISSEKGHPLHTALSTDLFHWEKIGSVAQIQETGALVPDYKYRDHSVLYYGEKTIKIAYSAFLHHWKVSQAPVLSPRPDSFDSGDLEVANAYVINGQIVLIYYAKNRKEEKQTFAVGAAFFDMQDPTHVIWRSDTPLWEQTDETAHEALKPLGTTIVADQLMLYWQVGEKNLYAVPCSIPTKHQGLKQKVFSHLVKKFSKNPIISPRPDKPWESRATFNSAAVVDEEKVHFLYRALGDKDLSVLGYATSTDGLHITERSDDPIYIPREPFETPGMQTFETFADHFASGGGYGGVEDPRITKVADRFYLTYVAFDGANPPRAAMSSIAEEDFRNKRWNKWDKAKLISAPGMVNKSAVIFPKQVNGKYVVLHRVYPNILIDYLDDLEFNDYLQGHHFIPPRKKFWDSKKIGAGAPPMETDDGWLLIYQSVGYQDPGRYKIGAMMLDRDNPSKVLYRTHMPIIEPEEWYENDGHKAGVVYPCGSVILNNKLHVYYGGADTVVCAASADVDEFLYEMKHHKEPKLKRVRSALFN